MFQFSGVWEDLTNAQGLPDMRIESLASSPDGSLWIGTHGRGIVRVGEGRLTQFGRREGLSGLGVFALEVTDDGDIWAATSDGVCRRSRASERFEVLERTRGSSFMWGASQDRNGSQWFCLERAEGRAPTVCRCTETTAEFVVVDREPNARGQSVRSAAIDSGGTLWFGGDRLYAQDGDGFTLVEGTASCDLREVTSIAPLGTGVIVATAYGVFFASRGECRVVDDIGYSVEALVSVGNRSIRATTRVGEIFEICEDLSVRYVSRCGVPLWRSAVMDSDDCLWLGTYGFGVRKYSEARILVADSYGASQIGAVHAVMAMEDQEWAATASGVYSTTGDPLPEVSSDGVRRLSETTALASDALGRIWLGKRNGAVYMVEGDRQVQCVKAGPLRRHRVDALVAAGESVVWASGRYANGIARYRGHDRVEEFAPTTHKLAPTRVSAIVVSADGIVYFGSADPAQPVTTYDGSDFRPFEGVNPGPVSAMCMDGQGVLWVGGEEGLWAYDENFARQYGIDDGLASELISALFIDSAERIWVGTEGGGMNVFDGQVFQSLRLEEPLHNTINDIVETCGGQILFATNGGLLRRTLQEAESSVLVEKLVADREYERPRDVQIPDTASRVTVSMFGWSRQSSEGIVYRYRLDSEDDWRQTRDRTLDLPVDRPGDFELVCQSVDSDLNYSKAERVAISVVADPRIAALNLALRTESLQGEIVSESAAMNGVLKQVREVAWTDLTVLVLGETGTGKGLIARQIHDMSERRDQPFIHVNCGAVQESLIDSELFGHERGAFTGALARRLGKFELAQGGTLFLDEIGDLPIESQARLLRVLQERTIERVGGNETIDVNVRIVAATNRDLGAAVRKDQFRADLFYRLNVFPVEVPPLRDRPEDAKLLALHFTESFASHLSRPAPRLSRESLAMIADYQWPGNVRELEHTIHRAVVLAEDVVAPEHLGVVLGRDGLEASKTEEILPLDEFERQYLCRVLKHTGGVIHGDRGAAKLLEMKPTTLRSRLEKLGVEYGRRRSGGKK